MKWLLFVTALATASGASVTPGASDAASEIRAAGLDPDACYRVREINFSKEDVRFYLTDGYLIFAKPVSGRRLGAVFAANAEGGDAELLVMPPNRSERASLARFTEAPNLAEYFRASVMVFTDGTAAELLKQIDEAGSKKSPEAGLLLSQSWDSVLRNLFSSFEVRLVRDALAPGNEGFFYAAVTGNKLGNFDVIYDPRSREQIVIGQLANRDDRLYFDYWTSFQARSFRNGTRRIPGVEFDISDFRLDVTVNPDLRITVTTRLKLSARPGTDRVFAFDISRRMRVASASIDGEPAEVFQRDSLREGLIRGDDNDMFLLVAPKPLAPGRKYEVEFRHEGDVVRRAGSGVLFVEARANWYPHRNLQFARYDLTFRYPRELTLASTGDVVEDREEGPTRITRRRTESPIRMAGFNLGDYEKAEVHRGGFRVQVYANRRLEAALQQRQQVLIPLRPAPFPEAPRRAGGDLFPMHVQPPLPSPGARLQSLAEEVSSALEFMSARFGPPPLPALTVSPIPGTFGQGFPGLVYLSTLSYLNSTDRPPALMDAVQQRFFSEILHAHETAHQWWGNTVTSPGYQDDWLMESLANYSALLFLEKRKGSRILESILDTYRENLLAKRPDGETVESTGPVSWGLRLQSSQAPGAWRTIAYEKGSWVIHMLRRRLGDKAFFGLLAELARRYRFQSVTSRQFQQLAAEFVPKGSVDPSLDNFFEHWVHGTGIPRLKLQYTLKGKAPNLTLAGTLVQTGVPDDFSVEAPIEVQVGKQKRTVWVKSSSEPAPWSITLRQRPSKVALDPGESVLAIKK